MKLMYVENGKISNRQMFRLYVFDLMGIATLLLPPYLSKLCGVDGIFAIILGTAVGFIYLFYLRWILRKMQMDAGTYLRKRTGKRFQNLVYILVLFHCVITAGFCAYVFTNVMQYSLVRESSYEIVLLVILIVAVYAVKGGIERRARVYEVLFWIVLLPYLFMMLATVKDFEVAYVDHIFTSSLENIGKGIYLVFLWMTPLFFLLFLVQKQEENHKKGMVQTVVLSVGIAGLILLGSYILLLGNFGKEALSTMKYPIITIMSTVQFKGNFLKRMDALMLAVWFFTLYALLNLHLHYGVEMLSSIGRKAEGKKSGWKMIVLAAVVFLVAYRMHLTNDNVWHFVDYYSYVAVPFMVVGPLAIWLIGRKEGKQHGV